MTTQEILQTKLQELEAALTENDPKMRVHLSEIHKHLIAFPDLVHLLSDDEIKTIIQSQAKLANAVLSTVAESSAKSAARKESARLKKLDLSDL